jgi:hypothetical protein
MKFPRSLWVVRFFFAALACSLAVSRAPAHEPLDISSLLTIYPDRLELVSTMGPDGVRQLLAGAGLSAEEIANALKSRGPDAPVDHPLKVAARLFQLKNNGEPLPVKKVKSVSEGMEIILTLTFPRPAPGTLAARASCYETIPGLHKGVLRIHDETAGPVDAAMLSPAKILFEVSLPAAK